jgi:bifunctional DNA-binding transcriptional regulator/antitoxin component of YhaV-PrlF toxin-antitoxin module
MSAGYSGTPLMKKLGIKEGYKICIINGPENYWELIGSLPSAVEIVDPYTENIDFLHIFSKSKDEYEQLIHAFKQQINQKGMIWISWPKKSSKVPTDINEDWIRHIAINNELVDVKVCAIDETWSGLKLVIPLKYRV